MAHRGLRTVPADRVDRAQDVPGHRGQLRAVGAIHLTRADKLPERCDLSIPADPRHTFDVFWQTYAEHYPFFHAKGTDWKAVRTAYRKRVNANTTDEELSTILTDMIRPPRRRPHLADHR